MSSSSSADVNYLSYACDSNSTCCWSLCAGSPYIVQIPAPDNNSTQFSPSNPASFASILKLADNASITLTNLVVTQGNECSVDANNKVNATVSGVFGVDTPNVGNQIFSVKGSSNVGIIGTLKGSGNRMNADIIVDNWSDQDYGGSTIHIEGAKHQTGRQLRVVYRIGFSTIIGNCKKLYLWSIGLTIYFYLKLILRTLLGIKQGQKGPSWF